MKLNDITLTEGGFVVGASGLEKPSKIAIFPNSIYFLGASSTPDHILVTKVDDKWIYYMRTYNLVSTRIERWIGEDLINKGTNTWLKTYGSHFPSLAKSLNANLNGKKGSENGKAKPKDYEKWDAIVVPAKEDKSSRNDYWRDLEAYGSVGQLVKTGEFTLTTTYKDLQDLKKDKKFKIVSSKKAAKSSD